LQSEDADKNRDIPQYGQGRFDPGVTSREGYYRDLLDALPHMVFETDTQGNFLYLNRAGRNQLGFSEEEGYRECSLFDHMGNKSKQTRNAMKRILDGGEVGRIETVIMMTGGQAVPAALHLTPVVEGDRVVRLRGIVENITQQKGTEKELEQTIAKLQKAAANIKTLRGLLPICSHCKRIRDDRGKWHQLEDYIRDHTEAEFSHSLCPDCMQSLYPDLFQQQSELEFKEREE
jgi:PAS domain S-box-containing protein